MNTLKISRKVQFLLKKKFHKNWVTNQSLSTFKYDELEVTTNKSNNISEKLNKDIGFGNHFTDHMLEVKWTEKNGWDKPVISPYHNFNLNPASKVFHYAQELYEGMKAYRCDDGKVRLFRPEMNMKRMVNTAIRAGLPEFDQNELLKCIKKLVKIDEEWVPNKPMHSLYIRPTFIGIEPTLGISSSKENLLYVILSPVGLYFKNNLDPVGLYADVNAVRAWPGGCGDKKMGSNYAPTIKIQQNANKEGCQQVLWLFGEEHQLTEAGTMNIFVFIINEQNERELITPPLDDGLILPGITRDSILSLSRQWGEFKVSERRITMKEVKKLAKENKIIEVFGSGTACIVSPVNRIKYLDENIVFSNDNDKLKISSKILSTLTDIHYGKVNHKWSVPIDF